MTARRKLNAFICDACRQANKRGDTHPGQMHAPGICDCPCRDEGRASRRERTP